MFSKPPLNAACRVARDGNQISLNKRIVNAALVFGGALSAFILFLWTWSGVVPSNGVGRRAGYVAIIFSVAFSSTLFAGVHECLCLAKPKRDGCFSWRHALQVWVTSTAGAIAFPLLPYILASIDFASGPPYSIDGISRILLIVMAICLYECYFGVSLLFLLMFSVLRKKMGSPLNLK